MLSIGGFTVKNNLGGLVPYVIVRTNQHEVDELLGNISETAPANPASGDFWYQIDHTGHTVTLMKYSGSTGAAVKNAQTLLIAKGYPCGGRITAGRETADGDFGPTTEKSVKSFQTQKKLTADGIIGAATWKALLTG